MLLVGGEHVRDVGMRASLAGALDALHARVQRVYVPLRASGSTGFLTYLQWEQHAPVIAPFEKSGERGQQHASAFPLFLT